MQAETEKLRSIRTSKLSKCLTELLAVYSNGRKSEQKLEPYLLALGDLSEAHLKLAFEETYRSHRSSFLPTPGEILGYLDRALAELPQAGSSARPDCQMCWGTGFTIVGLSDSTYRVAVRCKCLGKAGKAD